MTIVIIIIVIKYNPHISQVKRHRQPPVTTAEKAESGSDWGIDHAVL